MIEAKNGDKISLRQLANYLYEKSVEEHEGDASQDLENFYIALYFKKATDVSKAAEMLEEAPMKAKIIDIKIMDHDRRDDNRDPDHTFYTNELSALFNSLFCKKDDIVVMRSDSIIVT